MPLHLLGKKSWNVYNSDSIARVRRDEAAAAAREEAAEQRMQAEDAATRIALLRGEDPPVFPPAVESVYEPNNTRDDTLPRKRRRLRGEDDTDRDIRYAREDAEAGAKARHHLVKRDADDTPLHDHAGHIQLIAPPDEAALRKAEKNAEAEAEKSKKRQREEDQYTMRFSNAAGFQNGMQKPWYTASQTDTADQGVDRPVVLPHVPAKDVWAMQQAQRQLKRSEADKETWRKKRLAEVEEVKRSEDRRQRREKKQRHRNDDEDSLEGFKLDASTERKREHSDHDRSRRRHHRHRRRRTRSRSRDRYR